MTVTLERVASSAVGQIADTIRHQTRRPVIEYMSIKDGNDVTLYDVTYIGSFGSVVVVNVANDAVVTIQRRTFGQIVAR